MKIFISCSKDFYEEVGGIKSALEGKGHIVTPPNGWNDPLSEELIKKSNAKAEYVSWKAAMLRKNSTFVEASDAILVLNLDKRDKKGYIGGATFLEMFKAFELKKRIYVYNPVPEGSLRDEIEGFGPIVLSGNLDMIGEQA